MSTPTQPTKILLASLAVPGKGEGGSIHQKELADALNLKGFDAKLLAPKSASQKQLICKKNQIIHTFTLTKFSLPRSLDTFAQLPVVAWKRLEGYNTLYTRVNLFTFVLVFFARLMGMKVICEHNGWASSERIGAGRNNFVAYWEEKSQIWSANLSHKSRAVTKGIKNLLVKNGVPDKKVSVISNGCDINFFKPESKKAACKILSLDHNVFRIGYMGGLVFWQGLETAIKCMKMLPEEHPNGQKVVLSIFGTGPEEQKLKKLVNELQLQHRVFFHGYCDRSVAPHAISCFDIAIAPFTKKRNEEIGLSPIKIRDYAACGKPVVASAIPGITDFIDFGWLLCHDPDDPQAMKLSLEKLILSDKAILEAGKKARQYAEKNFDWNSISNQIEELLLD